MMRISQALQHNWSQLFGGNPIDDRNVVSSLNQSRAGSTGVTVGIYVDDLIMTSTDKSSVTDTRRRTHHYRGMVLDFSSHTHTHTHTHTHPYVSICQTGMVEDCSHFQLSHTTTGENFHHRKRVGYR
jgi:hypothetical protein